MIGERGEQPIAQLGGVLGFVGVEQLVLAVIGQQELVTSDESAQGGVHLEEPLVKTDDGHAGHGAVHGHAEQALTVDDGVDSGSASNQVQVIQQLKTDQITVDPCSLNGDVLMINGVGGSCTVTAKTNLGQPLKWKVTKGTDECTIKGSAAAISAQWNAYSTTRNYTVN
jgi:hypothetical protein